jgi:replicative DNA helicase
VAWYHDDRKGIPLPFEQLTESVGGGLQPGEVTIIGGWPGFRKTWFVKDMLVAAAKSGARCHEYANEMSGPLRTARLVASLTGIPTQRLRRRQLSADDWKRVLAVLNALPYETTATAGWSVEDYCRAMRRSRWDVVAIDTVTNLPCSKVDEWDRACTMLADTAAQTGTHLIEVSQLNKERDTTAIKPPPTGRDLRNTGQWYMRARVVVFVHFDQELADGTQVVKGLLPDGHVRVDKATHGDASQGYVDVTFNPKWLRFQALDDYRQPTEVAA